MTYEQAVDLLADNGQSQVLRFWDRLSEEDRGSLLYQIKNLNFEVISRMRGMLLSKKDVSAETDKADIEPVEVLELEGSEKAEAVREGEKALRSGAVGLILVAGGQGSRLGYDGPKGCFPVGPVSGCSLFEIHARKVLALGRKYSAEVPWYIMTSLVNHNATLEFFEDNGYFGLNPGQVYFFTQGMWPALDRDGHIILDAPGHIFMSPDGHGGTLSALADNGMLADMTSRGVETLFYFQVDNPMVEIADPGFVGVHRLRSADLSLKLCTKRDPMEGLGVPVMQGNSCRMVEYTELTDEERYAKRKDGRLRFLYGSVAIHLFSYDFLKKEAEAELPLHLASKKVPFCNEAGETVRPDTPNAFKFEKFIFDVMPEAASVLNVAFEREEEFSPVKNAEGEDSPATCSRDLSAKWARWLNLNGVTVPCDNDGFPLFGVEIDPLLARNPDDLTGVIKGTLSVKSGLLFKAPSTEQ